MNQSEKHGGEEDLAYHAEMPWGGPHRQPRGRGWGYGELGSAVDGESMKVAQVCPVEETLRELIEAGVGMGGSLAVDME